MGERDQLLSFLAKATNLSEDRQAEYEARRDSFDAKMSNVFEETFDLGIMHAVIYLQRSAVQVAPDLLCRLIFNALPELERVRSHIIEVKEGYWMLNQLLFGRMLVAWRAMRQKLLDTLTLDELRSRSRTFSLWEFIMEELVAPSVMLADAARGRSIRGDLPSETAWPLVLAAFKKGLRLLLLSGRHHDGCRDARDEKE